MKKETKIIIGLVILLVLTVGYITIGLYNKAKLQEQTEIYQQGMEDGYEFAITQLVQESINCKEVPIFYNPKGENITINLIATECLKGGI